MSIIETLYPLFSTPDAKTDHESLCQEIRDYVNSDVTGEIDLTYEIQSGNDKFQEIYNGGDFKPAQTTDMRILATIVKAITSVRDEQQAARAELDEEFAATAAELSSAVSGTPTGNDTAEADQDPTEFSESTETETETAVETAETTVEAQAQVEQPAETETRFKVRPAAAPVRLPAPSAANAFRTGANILPDTPRTKYSMIAAADVPRFTSGATLSMRELAEATKNRFDVMPLKQTGITGKRGPIAMIKRTFDRSLLTHNDARDHQVIDKVANERNLPGGSLIAAARENRRALTAAGCCTTMTNDIWCAPSETDYTLCPPLATLEGIVDLPTIPVTNGGIRYPVWDLAPTTWHGQIVDNTCETPLPPDFFTQDGNEKVCIEGPCPEWEEVRLNLAYLCVRGDILRNSTWPALTERFIEDTLIKHAHYMNHRHLSEIWAGSDPVADFDVSADGIGSTVDSVMDRMALLIAWFRERYHLGMTDTLEGIAPAWFKEYVKADIARKNNRPFASVTDAEVEELFAQYSTRMQWVYDTEGITPDASLDNGTPVDGRLMPGTWPNNVELVFYPAGSWVLGQADIITLDAFFDSSNLQQNKFTALFTEEGFLVFNRCNRSFRIRLTNLCRNGGVGAPVDITCPENPAPAPPPEGLVAAASASTARTSTKSGS